MLTALLAVAVSASALAWSKPVHLGIAAIADAHLTDAARSEIAKYLNSESIVLSAGWTSDMEDVKGYEYLKTWHCIAVDSKFRPVPATKMAKAFKGKDMSMAQASEGLQKVLKELESYKTLPKEKVAEDICCLLQILADIHCPGNIYFQGMSDNRSENKLQHGKSKPVSFREYCQSEILAAKFTLTSREYVHLLDRYPEDGIAQVTSGSMSEWIGRVAKIDRHFYNMTEPGFVYTDKEFAHFRNDAADDIAAIIALAGYRTARVLNGIFDSTVGVVPFK